MWQKTVHVTITRNSVSPDIGLTGVDRKALLDKNVRVAGAGCALYPLPHNSEIWQAQEEIDRVLGEADKPDMAGYMELKYLMRCINESMRLYPHPPVLLRRAEIADTLPGDHLHLSHSYLPLLFHRFRKLF